MITVVIPTHNSQAQLIDCIESVQKQHLVAEILIVDDGSTDATVSLARKYAEEDARIRVIAREHLGVSAARNAGLLLVSSPYLAFVDSDDLLPEDAFLRLYEAAARFESDMTYGDFAEFRGAVVGPVSNEFGISGSRTVSIQETIKSLLNTNPNSVSGSCCRILYRTSFLIDGDIRFPENVAMSEDFSFILRCLACNPIIAYTNFCTYLARRASTSTTQRYMPTLEADMDQVNLELFSHYSGDDELASLCYESAANSVWYACRNLYKPDSPFNASARRKNTRLIMQRHAETLDTIAFGGSMSKLKVALLRLGKALPSALWLLLELAACREQLSRALSVCR